MKNSKLPLSIKVLDKLASIVLILSVLFTFIMFIFFLLSLFSITENYTLLSMASKVSVGHYSPGVLQLNGNEYPVYYYEALANLEFSKYPKPFSDIATGYLLLVLLGNIYLIWSLKRFIVNVKHGLVFSFKNVILFKRLGYGILIIWIANVSYKLIYHFYIVKNITWDNGKVMIGKLFSIESLYLGLFVLMLAYIFDYGVKLQVEKDLTI